MKNNMLGECRKSSYSALWDNIAYIIALLVLIFGCSASSEPTSLDVQVSQQLREYPLSQKITVAKNSDETVFEPNIPVAGDVVFVADKPWEGNLSNYFTIFKDDDKYRMYYRGSHDSGGQLPTHEFTCYCESKDGFNWVRPNLGIVTFGGSKDNNIILSGVGAHNFTPFKDENPGFAVSSRYKAIATVLYNEKPALFSFVSSDAIHWVLNSDVPIFTGYTFDSQNIVFWDRIDKIYRIYFRDIVDGVRIIMFSQSADFKNWSKPIKVKINSNKTNENIQLYTNNIFRDHRYESVFWGLPARFYSESQQVEPLLMFSRDGLNFEISLTPIIPVTAPFDRNGNRSNYIVNGFITDENQSPLYVFATEAYYKGVGTRLRIFRYLVPAFGSLQFGQNIRTGVIETNVFFPTDQSGKITIKGDFSKSSAIIEGKLADADGLVMKDFAFDDALVSKPDDFTRVIEWKGGAKAVGKKVVMSLKGQNCRVWSVSEP